jgi:RimJ/RimL family protein N-acetyltransferase
MPQQIQGNATGFLTGERVYLRPLTKEDLIYIRHWANNPELRSLTGEVLPLSETGAEAYFEKLQQDQTRVWFMIVVKENSRVIGEAGLLRMFHAWRTSDLSIIIGEPDAWGQGYGTEAIEILLDYAFGYLNFHRIAIGVVGFNERALRFYEKIGFQREGVQRDGYYFNHQYHDFVMMSILEEEFRVRRRK